MSRKKRKPKRQEPVEAFSTPRATAFESIAGLAVRGYAIGFDDDGRLVAIDRDDPAETVDLEGWKVAAEMRAIIADPPVFAEPCQTMQ